MIQSEPWTEGPWETDDRGVMAPNVDLPNNVLFLVPVVRGRSDAERKANAHLIAAAPDMAKACDFALTILEAMGNGKGDAANACRAALLKAKGGA